MKDINLSINPSETVVFLGPSGCGKTTLLKLINRLIEPDSGAVFIDGGNTTSSSKEVLRRSIGYVIQDTGLLPHLTIKQNIALVGTITDQKISESKINELLGLIGLDESVLSKYPSELSGGQKQRIGIARALATDPEIILMDEPFSALDNITRTQLQDDFRNLKHLDNKTILLVTHDVQEAFKLGDRIVLLDGGVVQQFDEPQVLLRKPANEKVEEFLSNDRFILSLQTSMHDGVSAYEILNDPGTKSDEIERILKSIILS